MGIIFSKSDDELVDLCRVWSANRRVDPITGVEFVLNNGHNTDQNKYEIACMNILNGAYPASAESKQVILENLSGVCINSSDPVTQQEFGDLPRGDLDNIVFLDSSTDKKHCYILESIVDLINYSRRDDPHAVITNPLTRERLSEYDIQRVDTMVKYKILKLLKKGETKEVMALLSRFHDVLKDKEFTDLLVMKKIKTSIVPFLNGHDDPSSVKSIIFNDGSLISVPSEIDQFVSLTTLNLSGNLLESLPDEIGKLSLLVELNVSHNILTSLPNSLLNTPLVSIDVSYNQLEQYQIFGQTLENVDISHNKIRSLMHVNSDLLRNFNGSHNELDYLPSGFWTSRDRHINVLNLSNNNFSNFTYRFRIDKLNLAHNNIMSIGSSLHHEIKEIDLSFNQLVDFPFDKRFGNIEVCDLGNNRIKQIPDDFGGNGVLREFLINDNMLKTLPDDMINLRGLTMFDISNNEMRKIPKSIGKLELLEFFDASHNKITKIPSVIGRMQNLDYLDFSSNRIVTIPSFNIQDLQYLSFADNPLVLENPPNYMRTTIEDNIFVNMLSEE